MRLTIRSIAVMLPLLFLLPAAGMAETYYKWVDKDGVTHYSKEKPSDRPSEETLVMRSEGQAPPASTAATEEEQQPDPLLLDGSEAPVVEKMTEAQQKAAACTYASGGLKIAERFFQASLSAEESGSVQDTAKYVQEADQMRHMMYQNCAPAAPAS